MFDVETICLPLSLSIYLNDPAYANSPLGAGALPQGAWAKPRQCVVGEKPGREVRKSGVTMSVRGVEVT